AIRTRCHGNATTVAHHGQGPELPTVPACSLPLMRIAGRANEDLERFARLTLPAPTRPLVETKRPAQRVRLLPIDLPPEERDAVPTPPFGRFRRDAFRRPLLENDAQPLLAEGVVVRDLPSRLRRL